MEIQENPIVIKSEPNQENIKRVLMSNSETKADNGKKLKEYICKKCDGKQFKSLKLLRLHKKTEHSSVVETDIQYNYTYNNSMDVYYCNTCDLECLTKEEIEKHVVEHEENFTCDICKEHFHKAYTYSVHMKSHNDTNMYDCPLCEYKTKARTSLLTHINRMHLNKFLYTCNICKKGFNDIVMFKEHTEHHIRQYSFSCIVCKKTFPYSRYLLTHQIRNHIVGIKGLLLPNQCACCFRKFAKEESLLRHIKVHEPRTEPWKKTHLCDICGKGFARKDKLKVHYRVHTGIKPYSCNYCEKSFTKKDYLNMHERIHNGVKPYSCQYCGKCFNQGASLRIHVRSHTGERPYVCPICNFGLASKGALTIHLKSCSDDPNTVYLSNNKQDKISNIL